MERRIVMEKNIKKRKKILGCNCSGNSKGIKNNVNRQMIKKGSSMSQTKHLHISTAPVEKDDKQGINKEIVDVKVEETVFNDLEINEQTEMNHMEEAKEMESTKVSKMLTPLKNFFSKNE